MASNANKTSTATSQTSEQAKRIAQQARKGQKKPQTGKASATKARGGSRLGWIAIYVVIGIGALVLLVLAFQGKDERHAAESEGQFATPEIGGESLPPQSASGGADPAVGKTAPTVTGVNFDDEPVSIEPDGKGKVIFFLAHWCPHCQAEVPVIQQLVDSRGEELGVGNDVEMYAVATSSSPDRDNWPPEKWLAAEGWEEPIIVDSEQSDILATFGISGFPGFVVLDGDNKVLYRGNGELSEDQLVQLFEMARSGQSSSVEDNKGESSPTD